VTLAGTLGASLGPAGAAAVPFARSFCGDARRRRGALNKQGGRATLGGMQISKRAVYAAAAVFLALFGMVFFLLGRESTRRRSPTAMAATSPTIAQPPGEAEPRPPPPPSMPSAAGMPPPPMPSAAAVPPPPPASPPPMPSAAATPEAPAIEMAPMPALGAQPAGGDARAAARDYFSRMQAIQSVASTNDTSEFANKLLTASMTGDSSGFDDLVKVMQAGAARARAVTPPACCVEYHQRLLGMLGESTRMVEQLKAAIGKSDSTALTALAASASALQTRASALEDEAGQIKARLGLAH